MMFPAKKTLAALLLIALFAPSVSFLAVPKPVEAQGGGCIGNIIGGLIGSALNSVLSVPVGDKPTEAYTAGSFISDCIIKPLVKNLIRTMIHEFIWSIIDWVNSGFDDSGPRFVNDPEAFFTDVADQAAGQLIFDDPNLNFLCSPFQIDVRLALGFNTWNSFKKRINCTLSDVIKNSVNSVKTTNNSSDWGSFIQVTQNPQNNPYGAYQIAKHELDVRIGNKQFAIGKELDFGRGFLSTKKCQILDEYDYVYNKFGYPVDIEIVGQEEVCQTVTPGATIVDSVSKAVGSDIDEYLSREDIDALLGALMNQMIGQVFKATGIFSTTKTARAQFGSRIKTPSTSGGEAGTVGTLPANITDSIDTNGNSTLCEAISPLSGAEPTYVLDKTTSPVSVKNTVTGSQVLKSDGQLWNEADFNAVKMYCQRSVLDQQTQDIFEQISSGLGSGGNLSGDGRLIQFNLTSILVGASRVHSGNTYTYKAEYPLMAFSTIPFSSYKGPTPHWWYAVISLGKPQTISDFSLTGGTGKWSDWTLKEGTSIKFCLDTSNDNACTQPATSEIIISKTQAATLSTGQALNYNFPVPIKANKVVISNGTDYLTISKLQLFRPETEKGDGFDFCADTMDNDGDGKTDDKDTDCDPAEGGTTTPPTQNTLTAICSANPSSGSTNTPFVWSVTASGGNGSYSYSWSGTDGLTGSSSTLPPKTYSSLGQKTASVSVLSDSIIVNAQCGINVTLAVASIVLSTNSVLQTAASGTNVDSLTGVSGTVTYSNGTTKDISVTSSTDPDRQYYTTTISPNVSAGTESHTYFLIVDPPGDPIDGVTNYTVTYVVTVDGFTVGTDKEFTHLIKVE